MTSMAHPKCLSSLQLYACLYLLALARSHSVDPVSSSVRHLHQNPSASDPPSTTASPRLSASSALLHLPPPSIFVSLLQASHSDSRSTLLLCEIPHDAMLAIMSAAKISASWLTRLSSGVLLIMLSDLLCLPRPSIFLTLVGENKDH